MTSNNKTSRWSTPDDTPSVPGAVNESRHPAMTTWVFHAGGLPLSTISKQLSDALVFGTPMAYFDHSSVMFAEAKKLGTRSFQDYVGALMNRRLTPLCIIVPIVDLAWLSKEPAIRDQFSEPLRIIHLRYRDPVMQAVTILAKSSLLPSSDDVDDDSFARIADALVTLEEREAIAEAWLAEHGQRANDLSVEDLATPGVAALRYLIDAWSLSLPTEARILPIDSHCADHHLIVEKFRTEAKRRRWEQAVQIKAAHWEQRLNKSD